MTTATGVRYYLPQGLSQKEKNRLRVQNRCKECSEGLSGWMEKPGVFYLACHRHDRNHHEGVAKQFTPPSEKEILMRRETMDENIQAHRALAVKGVPLTGLINQEQATAILKTIWKDAPDTEVYKAAMLCKDFGLHPLMKHVFLIKFKDSWVTVLGIGATRLMMSRQGTFSYIDDTPRVMSKDEQERIFGKVDEHKIVAITKLRTKDGLEAQGYGKWAKTATAYGADKGNSGENMAFIRSERNAFGRLFPDAKLPRDVEIMDEAYLPPVSVERVNTETGEILGEQDEQAQNQGTSEAPESTSPQKVADAPSSPSFAVPPAQGRGAPPPFVTISKEDHDYFVSELKRVNLTEEQGRKALGGSVQVWLTKHQGTTIQDAVGEVKVLNGIKD